MADYIEPRVLKGFRDFLPQAEIVRRNLTEKIENTFRLFGFVPIDTPALEYADILLGKGGGETEKQIYRFKDNGGRDVAMRFDLTVPFARFVALHKEELAFPFKRYHIGKVWRGENTQRGRYREFTQCDFDIIGNDSVASDFEIIILVYETMRALGVDVKIHINHRGLFNRFLSHIGQIEKSAEILRTVDKLSKIGEEETVKILTEIAGNANAKKIMEYIGAKGDYFETLDKITELAGGECPESKRLRNIKGYILDAYFLESLKMADKFVLAPSITRGLDYYTGVVFETFLTDMPEIGSICSGGRYDNLAGLYSKKGAISGVGASIGLDRMIAAMEALGKLPACSSHDAAIVCEEADKWGGCQAVAWILRNAGIACEVFLQTTEDNPEADKFLVKQFKLAEKKGLKYVIIVFDESIVLRDIASRKNMEFPRYDFKEIIDFLKTGNCNPGIIFEKKWD